MKASAILKCVNCEGNLCNPCFRTTHSSRLSAKHKIVWFENEADLQQDLEMKSIKDSLTNMFVTLPNDQPKSTIEIVDDGDQSFLGKLLRKHDLPHSPDSSFWLDKIRDVQTLWEQLTIEGEMDDVLFKVRDQHLREASKIRNLTPVFTSTRFYNCFGGLLDTSYHCVYPKKVKELHEICSQLPMFITHRSGDGTVCVASASDSGMLPLRNVQINKVGHIELLHHHEVLTLIEELIINQKIELVY
ncbi:hypothetical protein GEMRC1_008671 [Eukaryota sp. GEM-RC1]